MAACSYCSARKGKRACPALGGEICTACCGKHRLVEIDCPPDCRWLGGLAVVRGGAVAGFTKEEYFAACDKLHAYVLSPRGKAPQRDALAFLLDTDERAPWQREEDPFPEWMQPLVVAYVNYGHRGEDGLRAVDRYLPAYGRALSPGEAAALVALQHAWPSLFEIVSVRVGAGFTVRDLFLDEEIDVREVSASAQVHRGDVLFAWMMRAGGAMEMTGANLLVPRGIVENVRREMADELARSRAAQPDVPMRQLLGDLADVGLVALRNGLARMPRPQLQTTHGEPLLFCEGHFVVHDRAEVGARLHTLADLERDDDEDDDSLEPAFTWLDRSPNSMLGGGPTVLGRIRIEGDKLIFETSSRERLTRGRTMLEELLGTLITHRADALTDPDAMMRDGRRPAGDDPADSLPPEIQAEILGDFLTGHYRRWLDEPVPAFKDRTPRKMASTKKGRAEVTRMLDDFERDSHDQPGVGPALWNELRRELGIPERTHAGEGLTYDGDHAPDPTAWLAADEDVRTRAVRAHHEARAGHPDTPNRNLHVSFHLIAENQVAAGEPPETAAALARLISEGASRHEAIHAVASVVATEVQAMVVEQRHYDRARVARSLAVLRAADWAGTVA